MKKTIVLIHGAWHGSWCWFELEKKLQNYNIVNIELPGHGKDNYNAKNTTLTDYVDYGLQEIEKIPTKVMVVAHSMGGIVLASLCEKIPEKIEKAIFLSAFVPGNGESLMQYAKMDIDSLVGKNLIPDPNNGVMRIQRESIRECFYQKSDYKYTLLAKETLTPNPIQPMAETLIIGEGFKSVNKFYIKTKYDNAISINIQEKMLEKASIKNVFSLNTDHSSFFSCPFTLSIYIKLIDLFY